AIAHGHVHEHLSHAHAGVHDAHDVVAELGGHQDDHQDDHHDVDHDGRAAVPAMGVAATAEVRDAGADGSHSHAHPVLDVVPRTRDVVRIPVPVLGAAMLAEAIALRATVLTIRAPLRADRTLLARPDPEDGPPPTLRAPPTR